MKVGVAYTTGVPDSVGGEAGFLHDAAEHGYRSLVQKTWPVDPGFDPLQLRLTEVGSFANEHGRHAIFELEEGLAVVDVHHSFARGTVAAATAAHARDLMAMLDELIPTETVDDASVPITFWAYNPNGLLNIRRQLDAPAWDEIAGNYAAGTRASVESLLRGWTPGRGGQLILWSGVPGTGKTTAIRALAREWRDWAEIHYVTDPDKFFGSESDYMLGVLLGESSALWRILLLEDAGELLAADARHQTGQGLSRFLNAVDGLIGQGLRLLVLVTTNEDLKKLNPAVARPGRCASQIEFAELSTPEAVLWLAAHGRGDLAAERSTLAELYALVEGSSGERLRRPVGFRA